MAIPGVPIDPKLIVNAIYEKRGVVSDAAKFLGISRTTIIKYRHEYPEIDFAINDSREKALADRSLFDYEIVQTAYEKLFENIQKNDTTAILFALKCKDKWNDGNSSHNSYSKEDLEHIAEIKQMIKSQNDISSSP